MDVANLLTDSKPHPQTRRAQAGVDPQAPDNPHASEQSAHPYGALSSGDTASSSQYNLTSSARLAGCAAPPKHITFELLLTEGTYHRARLPLRVNIFPHDGTESIISTVKNFHGLYDVGVGFENREGEVLIARYENFEDNMTVYVRVVENVSSSNATPRNSMSPRRARLGAPFEMLPPPQHAGHYISRPSSRAALKRSVSPQNSIGRRSQSTKARSRGSLKSRAGSTHGSTHGSIADPSADYNGEYSDSDGGNASVTSSRKDRNDIVASADISVENIVEGGRRKRARFEASELPLFVPSQVPVTTSVSSVSPQRRVESHTGASPFQYSNQQIFAYNQALPSPQSRTQSELSYLGHGHGGFAGPGQQLSNGQRGNMQYMPPRHPLNGMGGGILPTPDPTINSVISDEDVALQLMRLGDASNFSSHARMSNSTIDETFSGKANFDSSDEASDEGSDVEDDHIPTRVAVYSDESEDDCDIKDESFQSTNGIIIPEESGRPMKKVKLGKDQSLSAAVTIKAMKAPKARTASSSKAKAKTHTHTHGGFKVPISPTSIASQSRKGSGGSLNVHHTQLGTDEEDLSSKPRCQRCRKSKKGCDRQRPCGRCRDAGIGIEGCISEDEGNGRKGRYGRHMGVPIKKAFPATIAADASDGHAHGHQPVPGSMAAPGFIPDKNGKKRKRN